MPAIVVESSTGRRSASVERRRTSTNSSTESCGSKEYSMSPILRIFQSTNPPIFQCVHHSKRARGRVRQVGPPPPFRLISLPSYTRTCAPSLSSAVRVFGLPLSITHSPWTQRQHVRPHRLELLVRNVDKPIAAIQQSLPEGTRHQARIHDGKVAVDRADQ